MKICCSKCSSELMYDEKNTYFCGAKYNNDGYRIVFTRWVYDFDWGGIH